MIMKSHRQFISLILSIIFFQVSANAEFLCQAEVTYKWRRDTPPQNIPVKQAPADAAKPDETDASSADQVVFWTNVEQKGSSEADGKQKIGKVIISERASAERACLAAHENLAGCIAAKYAALSNSVSTLGFSAKKSVDDAIKADCEKQQGKCTGSSVGETKCSELITEAKPTEPPKDAKGKKK